MVLASDTELWIVWLDQSGRRRRVERLVLHLVLHYGSIAMNVRGMARPVVQRLFFEHSFLVIPLPAELCDSIKEEDAVRLVYPQPLELTAHPLGDAHGLSVANRLLSTRGLG